MVNFGLNSASLLGIFLAVAGASLYFMRSVRPELSRDHDIFFAAVGLLCGFILLFQGWRLDPILQFGQFLLTGSAVFFAVENIRLRKVATEQARRNTPIVDRDRPVSRTRVYTEAELDQINPYDYEATPNYDSPRLRGYEEPKPRPVRRRREEPPVSRSRTRSQRYASAPDRDSYSFREQPPGSTPIERDKQTSSTPVGRDRNSYRRRPDNNPPRERYSNGYDDWEQTDRWEEPSSRQRPRSSSGYTEDFTPPSPSRSPRRKKPDLSDLGRSYEDESEVISTDYVDYQPLDSSEDEGQANGWEEQNNYSEDRPSRSRNDRDRGNPINFDY